MFWQETISVAIVVFFPLCHTSIHILIAQNSVLVILFTYPNWGSFRERLSVEHIVEKSHTNSKLRSTENAVLWFSSFSELIYIYRYMYIYIDIYYSGHLLISKTWFTECEWLVDYDYRSPVVFTACTRTPVLARDSLVTWV